MISVSFSVDGCRCLISDLRIKTLIFFERIIDKKRVSSYQSKYVIVYMGFTLNFNFLFQVLFVPNENKSSTRMLSSRIRTVRCSGRLLGGGVCPRGHGVCSGGLPGLCLPGGECLPSALWGVHPRGQTDTCENITFTQLLLRR